MSVQSGLRPTERAVRNDNITTTTTTTTTTRFCLSASPLSSSLVSPWPPCSPSRSVDVSAAPFSSRPAMQRWTPRGPRSSAAAAGPWKRPSYCPGPRTTARPPIVGSRRQRCRITDRRRCDNRGSWACSHHTGIPPGLCRRRRHRHLRARRPSTTRSPSTRQRSPFLVPVTTTSMVSVIYKLLTSGFKGANGGHVPQTWLPTSFRRGHLVPLRTMENLLAVRAPPRTSLGEHTASSKAH